jgi:hypothetical protein
VTPPVTNPVTSRVGAFPSPIAHRPSPFGSGSNPPNPPYRASTDGGEDPDDEPQDAGSLRSPRPDHGCNDGWLDDGTDDVRVPCPTCKPHATVPR